VVEIHLRPNVVLVRAFLVQDLPEQVAELIRGVEQNLVAILLGKREPQVRPPPRNCLNKSASTIDDNHGSGTETFAHEIEIGFRQIFRLPDSANGQTMAGFFE
jgi:hypothetical protein